MEEMHLQAEDFGVKFAQAEVLEAKLEGEVKVLKQQMETLKLAQ